MDPIEDELLQYEDEPEQKEVSMKADASKKGHYVGVNATGFRDFLLNPELFNAIQDCGFEHPSQVQQECIPQALLGTDIIGQGKSGMGKTAVFVISVLQQITPVPGEISCLVLAPTRELAYQICAEFNRFSKYMDAVKTVVIYGGIPVSTSADLIKTEKPNIVVATPGRCLEMIKKKLLDVSKVRFFVLDEADRALEKEEKEGNSMKDDILAIYKRLPTEKQSMLFSATMPEEIRPVFRQLTRNATEVLVDDDKKLTLHGLQQFYVKLEEKQKNKQLAEILNNYQFNQVVIFVDTKQHAKALEHLLESLEYPTVSIFGDMKQADRIAAYRSFKNFEKRILVATDVVARGIDIERVNIVINYYMPKTSDTYLHRVGRAGRFGTKGLAISFVSTEEDEAVHKQIQERFNTTIPELPESVDSATYMNA